MLLGTIFNATTGGVTLNDFSELKLYSIYLSGFGVVSLYTTKTNKHNGDNASQANNVR